MAAATLALSPRYSGTELIATGGMADVYVATDVSLERLVAIKVLSERFAGDPEIRTRFSPRGADRRTIVAPTRTSSRSSVSRT